MSCGILRDRSPCPAYRSNKEGPEGTEEAAERWRSACSRRPAGDGVAADRQGGERAPDCWRGSTDAAGHSEGRATHEQGGLERALYEKDRPGAATLLDASQKQHIVATVFGGPPEGCARWTVRLVAEEALKRRLIPRAGRETIRVLLLHHDLKPWREKIVVRCRTQ
jgi:hypothetical protein